MDYDLQAPPSGAPLPPSKPLKPLPGLKLSESGDESKLSVGDDEDVTIRYTKINALFQSISQATGDALAVQGVPADEFTKIQARRDRSGRRFRFHYFADELMLIVTLPSGPHEYMGRAIDQAIFQEVVQMGLIDNWKSTGGETFTSNSGTMEADASGKPIPQRLEDSEWPTLVVEVGYSQSLLALRSTMRHWFDASSHQVKIVILAKVQQNQGKITIEKWQEGPPPSSRTGATNTRASLPLGYVEPYCDGPIFIEQTGTALSNPQSYSITRNVPLRLEFGLLFLRAPGPGEHDVVLDVRHLQRCAARTMEGRPARV